MRRRYDFAAILITETFAELEKRVGNYEARRQYAMEFGGMSKYDPTRTYDRIEHSPFPERTSSKEMQEARADMFSLLRAQRKYR